MKNKKLELMHIRGEKYLWKLPTATQDQAYAHASLCNVSVPIAQLLLNRGLSDEGAIQQFLFSSYERDVGHPALLKDAQKAVDRILYAIEHQEKILIAGDYDVDGITSAALLLTCLLPLGASVNFFLPNRMYDGYGLSIKTVQRAAESGYKVIITVDNGITAFEPALEAKRLGIDLIITDHHHPHAQLPEAFAVVDPHQADCLYPFKLFAGVGVGFKLMQLLYERVGRLLPVPVYELLMLGTVADVVPLLGENRFWVRHGLQQVNAQTSAALRVLKENARYAKASLSSTDIGFMIAPQLNALGRLEDPRAGVKFLIGSDEQETIRIGKILGELNQARKTIEKEIIREIESAIARGDIDVQSQKIIVAAKQGWPSGVIGLVASRLVGMYHRPAILLHLTDDGCAKGSCRSIPELNIFDALSAVQDVLLSFGGHPMAAGVSLRADKLPEFQQKLRDYVDPRLQAEDLVPKLELDAQLLLSDANGKLMDDMAYLEPFGCENAQPSFYVKQVSLVETPMLLKEEHVKCLVFADGIVKPVIFFGRPDLYPKLVAQRNMPFDMAVSVVENHWNGRTNVELQGFDVAGLVA